MTRQDPVEVRGRGLRVHERTGDVGVAEAKHRFGGVDLPATLAGTSAGLGVAALVGAAARAAGYELDGALDALSSSEIAAGLATLAVALLVGGWVAGRMARYDGGRNGIVTALWFLLLAGAGGLAAWPGDVEAREAAALVVGAVVAVLAAWWGGTLGERYHRRADALIVHTREGGLLEAVR